MLKSSTMPKDNDSAIDAKATDAIRPGHRLTTYMPIGEFLERIASLHRRIAGHYARLSAHPHADERIGIFADAARKQHEHVEQLLDSYRSRHANERALTTWLQYLPDEQIQAMIQAVPREGASASEVIDHAIDLERAFQGLYEELVDSTGAESVHELFESLVQLALDRARRVSGARQELDMG